MRRQTALAFITLAAACAAPSPANVAPAPRREVYDLIVRGGSVLDGTGSPMRRADVGVVGSRVAKIGDLSGDSAVITIDAGGLVVTPGFINMHSHASQLSPALNMLRQGVTTELVNPDGGGPVDIARQLAAAESSPLAVNVGAYAPFNSAWRTVVGDSDRRPTPEQIAQITALLRTALEAGAWGISAGLDYKPAYYAKTDEIVAALSPLREWRTNFPNHDRLTPEAGYSSVAAMRETIEIGERAGIVPVITHMKLQGKDQGRTDEALAMFRAATARGVYTAADVYPYLAGQSALVALFVPGWAVEGGREAFLQRLRNPTERARIVRETEEALVARVGTPANIRLIDRNQTIADLMPGFGTTSAGEAVIRVLETTSPGMIATFGAEPDLVKIMQYPDAAIACDCGAAPTSAHPRGFGTFPRVLGRYVRESHALSLADAVRKMTGLPATIVGLVDRGFLAVGMFADITVFDPATVIDHATFERPMEWSEGVRHVVVNGRVALRNNEPVAVNAGRALRRTKLMPSRPMNIAASRDLRLSAADGARRLTVDVARNVLRVEDNGAAMEVVEFGLLQTSPNWASITGRLRDSATGLQSGFTLIVDRAAGVASLEVDGRSSVAFRLSR